ncbi:MAG: hypothetical protein ACOY0T_30395 [Myxococcota bacterium]
MKYSRTGLACAAALLFSGTSALADPPAGAGTSTSTVERCVNLHEQARIQRVQEQWQLARESMTACAAETCPLALRVDCQDWLEELARVLPSLLIVIERDDGDTSPVRLELDGREITLPEPLGPIELLPGTHRLRASMLGRTPIELEVSLQKGEKNRVVHLRFARPAPVSVPPSEPVKTSAPSPHPSRPRRPIPTETYLLSGGALAAFTTSGILLGSALSSLSAARDSCAPVCEGSMRESIDRRLLAADLFGGLGFALTGAALYTFLTRPSETKPHVPAANVKVAPGYAAISLEHRF